MKVFHCDHCGNLIFFENVSCLRCGHTLGFLPDVADLCALEKDPEGTWRALCPEACARRYRLCRNSEAHQVCNWMIEANDANPFCLACRLNETIPDLTIPGNLMRWQKLEWAKRRVVYSLIHLGLPLETAPGFFERPPLRFRFLGTDADGSQPLTGHDQGTITVNIAEADDDERERRRIHLREPYRTLLGHLRHEVAHYYWDQLIAGTARQVKFRELFGNEEADYSVALERYYEEGPPADWQARFISAYASAHPWEDWAETWAHYLHIEDTVETAAGFGISVRPEDHPAAPTMTAEPAEVADPDSRFENVLKHWMPLTYVLNSLNRGMGLPDLYPFVLSPAVIAKLRFVHQTVRNYRDNSRS